MLPVVQKIIIAALFSLLCTVSTQAQPYYFRHYQVENGLLNNTIHCSTQDRNGFMWFGTKEGLNRFDGYRFKLFEFEKVETQHFGDNRIFCLYNDDNGQLWVGARKGLYRYDEHTEKLVRFPGSPDEVSSIQMDNEGQLWFLSWNNIYRHDFKRKQTVRYLSNDYFNATWICRATNGDMWFTAADGGLFKFIPEQEKFKHFDVYSHSVEPSSRWILKAIPAGKDLLFLATSSQGLKAFNTNDGSYRDVLPYTPEKVSLFVRDILQSAPNEYWLATESGIFIYDTLKQTFTNLKKKFLDPYSISDNAVYTLCKDVEGGIWAGTYFGGVNYYPKQYSLFQKYFPDPGNSGISGSAVREMCADRDNNIWIGTEDAGLNKLDPRTGKITQFHPTGDRTGIAYSNIHGLVMDSLELWIGTFEHGLDRMDIRTGKVTRHYDAGWTTHQIKSNFIVSLLRTRAGVIYVGTSNGLFRYRRSTDDFEQVPGSPMNTFYASLLEDESGSIWAGTYGRGVYIFDTRTGKKDSINIRGGLTNESITAILEDRRHNIWLCTEGGGVCVVNSAKKIVQYYSTKNGLPSNYIFKALEDHAGNIWLSSSRGLAKLNPLRHLVVTYTSANGLLNDQFNYNSGFKDQDGRLYFGSIKGMISFQPGDFRANSFNPAVFITGFQVDNRELEVGTDSSWLHSSIIHTSHITLPYDQSSFSIDFAALSYTSPDKTEYRYKLEGLEKDWTHLSTNRKVYFTKVSPGDYRFLVQAATDGKWDQVPRELRIEILPPFWATKWAYAFYTLVAGAIIYFVIRGYHRRTQVRKEKEIYEAKIDFFTNVAHEIKTPLTLIKGPLENLLEKTPALPTIREDVYTMEKNTNRLLTLVQQILDFRQTETKRFSLDFEKVNLQKVMEEEFVLFKPVAAKKNMEYVLHVPPQPVQIYADEEALNKIFSNVFGNAVKYGVKEAHITLKQPARNWIEIEVKSDGYKIPADMSEKIFEPFFRLRENHKQKGTGIGLALARSLAELHGGKLFLKDSTGPYNLFVLQLPVLIENN